MSNQDWMSLSRDTFQDAIENLKIKCGPDGEYLPVKTRYYQILPPPTYEGETIYGPITQMEYVAVLNENKLEWKEVKNELANCY